SIPYWLEGTLIRNGPGIFKFGNDVYNHAFDGLAVLHRYHISNGKVTYNNRALEGEAYTTNMVANRIVVSQFGTVAFPDPCKSLFQRLQSEFYIPLLDNCNVNVCYFGDQLYAMTETDIIRRIDPMTLKTIGDKTSIPNYIAINHASAHPHVFDDGTAYNIGSSFHHKKGFYYAIIKIPPKTCYSGAKIVAQIPFTFEGHPSYIHSFALTKDKIVLIESSLRLDLLKFQSRIFTNSAISDSFVWDPSVKPRFRVVSLTDGKIHPIFYEADAFFTFHHINAYEEDDQIVVDVAAYDEGEIVTSLDAVKLMEAKPIKASARRFVLPLKIDKATGKNLVTLKDCKATATLQPYSMKVFLEPQYLTDDWIELPRINYAFNGQKYNYFYGVANFKDKVWTTPLPDSITKVDIENDEVTHWAEEGQIPSEPVFITRPGAVEEDDGVLLSALMDKDVENRVTLLILDAKSSIPSWLEGTLIRNGPGIFKIGNETYNHVFDGLSILHRYHISNGKATYNSRALKSYAYEKNMAAKRIIVSEFGTVAFIDPCKSIFQRFQLDFEALVTDNGNVNVAHYGDQLYAMTETNAIRRIDPTTLKTIGGKTIIPKYVAVNHASAHPHIREDGTIYNVGTSYVSNGGFYYAVIKIPPAFGRNETNYKGAKIVAEIPFTSKRYPSYYHSFGITKDKMVFIEFPMRMDLLKLATSPFTHTAIFDALRWNSTEKTRFHVVSLINGKIHPITYESKGFFSFHHINAYEEDDQIVVDLAAYDRADIVMSLTALRLLEGDLHEANARRFVLPLKIDRATTGKNLVTLKDCKATAILQKDTGSTPKLFLEAQDLTKKYVELPRINYKYNGRKYNYFYGIANQEDEVWTSPIPDSLIKVDIKNNKVIPWLEVDQIPSEPVFIAKPGATEEDDGVILTALMDRYIEKQVTLLILNAKNMTELARVKFQTEGAFTSTFHGQWANPADKIHRY
ncbi:Retinoid isomerohydrolase, partial [Pseudolycoriella hygida]